MKIEIQAIKAFKDNYIWLLTNPENSTAICIDPGDAKPVLEVLTKENLYLCAILITHHHWDHTGGIAGLTRHNKTQVYGPKSSIEGLTNIIKEKDHLIFKELDVDFTIIEIPGHTLDHVAYYGQGLLFCGDTLFSGGCGRLFEGSAEQMLHSLSRLAALPDDTKVYCAHEYTESNLKFALKLEPNNLILAQRYAEIKRVRQRQENTLPSTIALEKATNPFLRCHLPSIQKAASEHCKKNIHDPTETFSVIREWKTSIV